jgi:signal transduction histidine kinase
VRSFVARTVGLEQRLAVQMVEGPAGIVHADGDQLEQLLINLVRNAVDATLEATSDGRVRVGWQRRAGAFELWVEDDGPGLANTGNLFVPFYTTKPGGSGIGLVLSRQIAEAHGGTVTLEHRTDARGCRATVRLPLIQ